MNTRVYRRWNVAAFAAMIALVPFAQAQAQAEPSSGTSPSSEHHDRPNILLIVWDTVRADYLSLYGYPQSTTPFLDKWSRGARVYEDCVSVGSTTVPTHVSMFTGLLPLEHGVTNSTPTVDDSFELLAETLKAAGYETYMFSENPKIAERNKIAQGFDTVEHPWSPAYRERSFKYMLECVPENDRSTNLTALLRQPRQRNQSLKSAGPCMEEAVLKHLAARPAGKPFFVFLNCMTAHYPLIPSREQRAAVMTREQVERSYQVDRTAWPFWCYVFGRHEYTDEEIELTRLTYAAAIRELDSGLRSLMTELERRGELKNTIVIVTSDHGEHLGEHHLLDHQYSVYEPLLRVPLILFYPPAIQAGRERVPATNMDIYPTLLELAGLPAPAAMKAVSLLRTPTNRVRLGTYTGAERKRPLAMRRAFADFDPAPWNRELHAFYSGSYKLIRGSDGQTALYRPTDDPVELTNLFDTARNTSEAIKREYEEYLSTLAKPRATEAAAEPVSAEEAARLRAIGYMDEDSEDSSESQAPASAPTPSPAVKPSPAEIRTGSVAPQIELRTAPFIDLHFYVRAHLDDPIASPPGNAFEKAIEAARALDRELSGPAVWNMVEANWLTCRDASEALEISARLPEQRQLRSGAVMHIREPASRLLRAYIEYEPTFLEKVWPKHREELERTRARLERELLPRQAECFEFIQKHLGFGAGSRLIPVYLTAEAPEPGGFTLRRMGGENCCIVAVAGVEDSLLSEIVLHETIHVLETADTGDNVLRQFETELKRGGLTPRDKLMHDAPHTLIFVQAAETVRRVLDPKHCDYGEARGYYVKLPQVSSIIREAWRAYLDGGLTRKDALQRMATQVNTLARETP